MVEKDLGQATIVYEDPDGETVEETVDNEQIAYFQDHWIVKTGEHDSGHDIVRRIPAKRVYHVERSVEEFEREVRTLRDQVQSMADDLREKLSGSPIGGSGRGDTGTGGSRTGGSGTGDPEDVEVRHVDVEGGESGGSDTGGTGDENDEE